VFLLSSGFRVTSAFDGTAVDARTWRAIVPNPREVGTDREIAHDSSVSVLAAVVIFGDKGGLAVSTEE